MFREDAGGQTSSGSSGVNTSTNQDTIQDTQDTNQDPISRGLKGKRYKCRK